MSYIVEGENNQICLTIAENIAEHLRSTNKLYIIVEPDEFGDPAAYIHTGCISVIIYQMGISLGANSFNHRDIHDTNQLDKCELSDPVGFDRFCQNIIIAISKHNGSYRC